MPVPAQGIPSPGPHSPFAGLEVGAQSDVFGSASAATISSPGASWNADDDSISDRPTGPLVVPPQLPPHPAASAKAPVSDSPHQASMPPAPASASAPVRELPPDLLQLYGDYLRDMEPEADEAADAPAVPAASAGAPASANPVLPPAVSSQPTPFAANGFAAPTMPEQRPAQPRSVESTGTRSDKLIFWQLRYQLEAYVRRAASSYGVHTSSGDPSGVIDALRRSGFVDEADLRIAEGILAVTDRVTAGAAPTIEDYRQALMLYLLYHRSHLGT